MSKSNRMLFTVSLASAGVLAGCHDTPLEPAGSAVPAAPAFARAGGAGPIAGQYIVVFRKDVADPDKRAKELVGKHRGKLKHAYKTALKGFAAELSADAAAALESDSGVAYVEQDQPVFATTTQSNVTWGLDRSDQRALPLTNTYTYTPTGAGVTVYIVDTGIRFDHQQFGGRASAGYDAVGDGRNGADCNGHGTHVAGTVGGLSFGIAKDVRLVAVRVLGCDGSGTTSGVIAGVDWVTQQKTANPGAPAVANMSLGGGASQALDDAVRRSIAAGVTYAVAAGNSNVDACGDSPARVPEALTVGATTSTDARASYSNYGSCVDLFAPGSSITSAWHTGSTAINTISGTSMAAPHVAGVAALYLQNNPGAAPSAVANAILGTATTNRVTGAGTGSPNRLLFAPLTTDGNGGGTVTTAPCTSCTAYTGSLSGSGAYQFQPGGSYYLSSVSGTHRGWLRGPSGTDFDLYLQKWTGSYWATVARAESASSEESIAYAGTSGYYRWVVQSYAGSGAYTFWLQKP